MRRHLLLSLAAAIGFAVPAIAAPLPQGDQPNSGSAYAIAAPGAPDAAASQSTPPLANGHSGTMRNGLLPNPPTYG
jgi:hypothetical protein